MAEKTAGGPKTNGVYAKSFGDLPFRSSGLPWLEERRQREFDLFRRTDFPTRAQESWKYVDLAPVLETSFAEPAKSDAERLDLRWLKKHGHDEASTRLVFVNGFHCAKHSRTEALPAGVVFRDLASSVSLFPELASAHLVSAPSDAEDPFGMINGFSFRDGAFLYVPKGVELADAAHLWFVAASDESAPTASYARTLIIAEPGSRGRVVIHTGALGGGRYLANHVLEIRLGEKASLSVVLVQEESASGYDFVSTRAKLGAESVLDFTSAAFGGFSKRHTRVDLDGAYSFASLKGLAVMSAQAEAHDHTVINHASPAGVSRQLFKNILLDRSRGEYSGLVHVHKEGQKSDSNQLNRNLLLSDDARAHSRPQLKIDADDVKCNHGSTIGQLSPEELFYLRSRGLDESSARSLLVYGFAEEVIGDLGPEPFKAGLENLVRKELKSVIAA